MTVDSGWNESAEAYIAFQDRCNPKRMLLLDPMMLHLCRGARGRLALDVGCGEWSRTFDWAGIGIVNRHRPLSAYRAAYPRSGLILRELLEPVRVDRSLRSHPSIADRFRVPEFRVMKWQKAAAQ